MPAPNDLRANRRDLFLAGFLVLFLELACIRWLGAWVTFLQFFTNLVLIAAFLGMSAGCAAARSRTDWLRRTPWLALATIGAAVLLRFAYRRWSGLAIDVGGQRDAPQVVFFGTEYRDVDLAAFAVPVEAIGAVFFVLVALLFTGPGQVLGRCLNRDPDRVRAYASNVLGSVAGIAAFSLLSLRNARPVLWFAAGLTGVAYFLAREGRLRRRDAALLAAAGLLVLLADIPTRARYDYRWSPYYWVIHDRERREITVNDIGHQTMVPFDEEKKGSVYSLIHLLRRDAGEPPFGTALVIGAGSGNDVAHCLRHGVARVDAVEIDPVIQQLGAEFHPDRPWDDPRVAVHIDDGRRFLRRPGGPYDLVVYALVDSLVLHSSVANVRLESFLFTEQALADVRAALAPDGIFVTYNYFRQGFIVMRMAAMIERVFGAPPLVVSLPFLGEIREGDPLRDRITMLVAGDTARIRAAFARSGSFWLARKLDRHDGVNAFGPAPPAVPGAGPDAFDRIAPARLVPPAEPIAAATDDWPFLYLRSPMVPALYLRGAAILVLIGLALLRWIAPGRGLRPDGRMFFLGAGFLLLETKAVVHLSLVFGSTWIVNSLVFAAILVTILLANLLVLRAGRLRTAPYWAGLFAGLAANALVPFDLFLGGGALVRYAAPCLLVAAPVFFAGVIFAATFRGSRDPDRDFGSNIAGAVVGGFAEYLSMLVGFRALVLVAAGFYALSAACRRRR